MSRRLPITVVPLVLLGTLAITAGAQEHGPITPPPKYEVKRLPTNPDPGRPPAPAEEIIKRLGANEDLFKRAYEAYRLEQTIRVQEISDDSSPGGEYSVTGEIFTKPDGKRYERILKQPESTLHRTTFSLEDVETLAQLPLFILTTEELPKYDITYQGQQKLDEIGTLNFRVKPKQIVRGQRLFDGVIWVDDLEFAIVKSYGKFVTEVVDEGNPLPFSIFETYRENFAGKYWFPTYIRSDDTVALSKGQLHLRLLIRSTNLQPGGGATAGTTSDTPKPQLAKPPQN